MKKNRSGLFIAVFLVIVAIAAAAFYFVWNKPRRSVSNETAIEVTATKLVQDYQANEAVANKKYLDKALQVSGTVTDVNANQEGHTTVSLSSADPMTSVFCTLKEKNAAIKSGATVTIKGFCSGMLSDVRIREAEIVK